MNKLLLTILVSFLYFSPTTSFAEHACTLDFDTVCPDTTQVCGAKAAGGNGCVVEGLGNCYSTGLFAYEVGALDNAQFRLRRPIRSLRVFFATEGEGSAASMRFFDEAGLQIEGTLSSNGDCSGDVMPDAQFVSFPTPVAKIRITAGDVPVFIDTMELNAVE